MSDVANPVCLLAVEEKPNSYLPIDLNNIGVDSVHTFCTLMEIDAFVFKYGIFYVKNYLIENNIMSKETLEKDFVIIYDNNGKRRKLPVINKEIVENNNLLDVISFKIYDKDFVNRILNKINLLNIDERLKIGLIDALKVADINLFINLYEMLPYILKRNLYYYIVKSVTKNYVISRKRKDAEV